MSLPRWWCFSFRSPVLVDTDQRNILCPHLCYEFCRGNSAAAPPDPRMDVSRRIKQHITKKRALKQGLFMEYAQVLGMKPEDNVATSLMKIWSQVGHVL